eukprot:scaffold6450_cov415-Prasinococcus_capsulatus_cf.AAC.11
MLAFGLVVGNALFRRMRGSQHRPLLRASAAGCRDGVLRARGGGAVLVLQVRRRQQLLLGAGVLRQVRSASLAGGLALSLACQCASTSACMFAPAVTLQLSFSRAVGGLRYRAAREPLNSSCCACGCLCCMPCHAFLPFVCARSCCMNPAQPFFAELARAPRSRLPGTGEWGSTFQACLGRCRTNSKSTVHENAYIRSVGCGWIGRR